jgi:hypothetical protein
VSQSWKGIARAAKTLKETCFLYDLKNYNAGIIMQKVKAGEQTKERKQKAEHQICI